MLAGDSVSSTRRSGPKTIYTQAVTASTEGCRAFRDAHQGRRPWFVWHWTGQTFSSLTTISNTLAPSGPASFIGFQSAHTLHAACGSFKTPCGKKRDSKMHRTRRTCMTVPFFNMSCRPRKFIHTTLLRRPCPPCLSQRGGKYKILRSSSCTTQKYCRGLCR